MLAFNEDVDGDPFLELFLAKFKNLVIPITSLVSVALAKHGEHVATHQKFTEKRLAEDVATRHVVHGRIKKGGKENGVDKSRWVIGRNQNRGINLDSTAIVQINLAEQKAVHHMDERGEK